ncbi:MAG: ABC transporter ATP-binding protein [Trueperaceae bacterium]|nr:ABC transporter ATP-binding protein [Trueperaceae bacterium]
MKPFWDAFRLLNKKEQKEVYYLLPAIVIRALLEVAAIMFLSPFLSLVTNPDSLSQSGFLSRLYDSLRFSSPGAFFIFMGTVSLVLIVVSNGFSMLVTWLLLRFSWLRDYTLSHRLLAAYLHRPYLFFLGRNTADMGKNMLLEVQQGIRGVLIPGMQVVANGVVALAIMLLLILMNPLMALGLGVFLALAYLGIYGSLRRYLGRIGKARMQESKERFQTVNEALGGVKEIKLLAKEGFFLDRYAQTARRYAHYMAQSEVMAFLPKYLLDTLAFGGLVGILLYFLMAGKNLTDALPVIGLYAFAGYRLVPALQQVYRSLSSMRFNAAVIKDIAQDLEGQPFQGSEAERALAFQNEIRLEHLSFHYPDTQGAALNDIHLSIRKNQSVAFVGSTGSGKSTLVDLILGLLNPSQGSIHIDGRPLEFKNLRAWQKNLGYVPQSIYLTDASIAENIALGYTPSEIDQKALEKAARIANLHDFVLTLEKGYETFVGERGVRLSGGQRQRIGIARALYHDPNILILDEATSALDNVTEEAVFSAINKLMGQKTIIMIAHRISTVKHCDAIFVIEAGRIVSQGTYESLVSSSERFRALAQVKG